MAVLISQIITNIDRHTGDETNDRFSQAARYDAITEAVVCLQEEHQSELQNFTYVLNYVDTINSYLISSALSDILMSSDLRRMEGENNKLFTFKDGKSLQEDISNGNTDESYALERYNGKAYIVINKSSKYPAQVVSQFESLTDGGTWTLDAVTSDAINLSLDTVGFTQGNGCLMLDADVSQSGNNRISMYADDLDSLDFTEVKGLSSALLEVYLPEVTYFSSVTLSWGTDSSNYYSATKTTPVSGAWAVGWNTVKVDWTGATTQTGTVDITDINYVRIDLNYTASQGDASQYRVDYLRFARNEQLTLHYLSLNVGKDTNGTGISLFSAPTDTPFFSGQYDEAKFFVGHYAAGILMQDNRLFDEAAEQFKQADERLKKLKLILPSSSAKQTNAFKVGGISFNKRK